MKMQIHSLPVDAALVKIAVSPVKLYTKQHCAHKRCFIKHYSRDEMELRPITADLEKRIVERIVWESLSK